mmetsp:Transcript_16316/g.48923  ORF Transcript_16316/g.48923 Transcript_16316/m.48923 type:complete len:796 (-) Transcript_16316:334-2721(-)
MAASSYGPRGWKAALAAEERLRGAAGMARAQLQTLPATAAAAATAAVKLGGSISEASRGALEEHTLPWRMPKDTQQMPERDCPAAPGGVPEAPPCQVSPQHWLRMGGCLAAVALVAFLVGWALGRWHADRGHRRRQAADLAAAAAAAPATAAAHQGRAQAGGSPEKGAVPAAVEAAVLKAARELDAAIDPSGSALSTEKVSHHSGGRLASPADTEAPSPREVSCTIASQLDLRTTSPVASGSAASPSAEATLGLSQGRRVHTGSAQAEACTPTESVPAHNVAQRAASDGDGICSYTGSGDLPAVSTSHYQSLQPLLSSASLGADSSPQASEQSGAPTVSAGADGHLPAAAHAAELSSSSSTGEYDGRDKGTQKLRHAEGHGSSAVHHDPASEDMATMTTVMAAGKQRAQLPAGSGSSGAPSLADQLQGARPAAYASIPALPPDHDQTSLECGAPVSAEGEAAWREAVHLVSTATARLGISLADMPAVERVQLISVAVAAWQTIQQREAQRTAAAQGDQANQLRGQHNRLVHSGLVDKQTRHGMAEAARGASALRAGLADCTFVGLALMSVALLYCGLKYGLLHVRLAACPSPAVPSSVSVFRPWEALAPLQAAACWLFTIGDVLFGVVLLLTAAFLVLKTRLLAGGYAMFPLNKLLLGLGVACGAAGYFAVGKIGGRRETWLLMWWSWIAVQCTITMNLQMIYGLLQKHPGFSCGTLDSGASGKNGGIGSGGNSDLSGAGVWPKLGELLRVTAKPGFVVVMALWWPLVMGCTPFDRSVVGEMRTLLTWHSAARVS